MDGAVVEPVDGVLLMGKFKLPMQSSTFCMHPQGLFNICPMSMRVASYEYMSSFTNVWMQVVVGSV